MLRENNESSGLKENGIQFPEQRKENGAPEKIFNPEAEIANFKSKPSFKEQDLDTYVKAVHNLVESDPSPQAAQKALEAHLEIMKTLGNAREILDAIANTRAEKARKEEGQSTFTQDIVVLNTILQAEKERKAKENTAIEEQRKILGISPTGDLPEQNLQLWKNRLLRLVLLPHSIPSLGKF